MTVWIPLQTQHSVPLRHSAQALPALGTLFCTETAVSDKRYYPTFARTKPTDSQISKSVVSLLRMFHWNKVSFIHSNLTSVHHVADNVYSVFSSVFSPCSPCSLVFSSVFSPCSPCSLVFSSVFSPCSPCSLVFSSVFSPCSPVP
ncbi:hypothetical protein ACOMHN_025057 [Nucella lapillus]